MSGVCIKRSWYTGVCRGHQVGRGGRVKGMMSMFMPQESPKRVPVAWGTRWVGVIM
jgi:hypothetical protein